MSAEAQFELFYDDPLTPVLIGSFDEFVAAQAAMKERASQVPGRYFIWSPEQEEVLAQLRTDSPPYAPNRGAAGHTDCGEAIRQTVNDWIRHGGAFDAVVDFDAVDRDPNDPQRFGPQAGSSDNLHPGDPGYKLMADAFDLALFDSSAVTKPVKNSHKR